MKGLPLHTACVGAKFVEYLVYQMVRFAPGEMEGAVPAMK